MNGECSYYFDENDPSTWGPDEESAAYWQERYEELIESIEREVEELKAKVEDADEEKIDELEFELLQKKQELNRNQRNFPVIGEDFLDGGRWKCPHEVVHDGRCTFHQPRSDGPDETAAETEQSNRTGDTDAEKVALFDAIARAIEERDQNYARFIGASIGRVELTPEDYQERGWESFGAGLPSDAALDFRFAKVHGSFTAVGRLSEPFEFGRPVFLSIISRGRTSFRESQFSQHISVDTSVFQSEGSFAGTKFHNAATFEHVRFTGAHSGTFNDAEFSGGDSGQFTDAEFTGDHSGVFMDAEFSGDNSGYFSGAEFSGDRSGWFVNAEFTGGDSGQFTDAEFTGDHSGVFMDAEFTGDHSGGFADAEFTGDQSGSYFHTEFTGDQSGYFSGAEFTGNQSGRFRNTEFTGYHSGWFGRAKFAGDQSGDYFGAEFTGDDSGYYLGADFTGDQSGLFERTEFTGDQSGRFKITKFTGERSGDFSHARFPIASAGSFGPSGRTIFSSISSASFRDAFFVEVNFGSVEFGGEMVDEGTEEAISDGGTATAQAREPQLPNQDANPTPETTANKDEPGSAPVSFAGARFGTVSFDDAVFHRPVSFDRARFESESSFAADFAATVTFDGAIFDDRVRAIKLSNSEGRTHSFTGVEFRSSADLSDCDSLTGSSFVGATLHRTSLSGVDLSKADFSDADLTGATLDGASLHDAKLKNTILESVHADNETFRRTFEASAGSPTDSDWINYSCMYDPRRDLLGKDSNAESVAVSYDDSETETDSVSKKESHNRKDPTSEACIENAYTSVAVYQKLEQVARYNALSGPQGKLFLARKNVERCRYWHQMRTGENIRARLDALSLWLRSWAAKLVLNYGESPWRVIATSAFIVVFCALIYPLGFIRAVGGPPLSYGPTPSTWVPALFDSFYVSLLTFATADLGQFQPIGYGRLLVTAEASAGLVLFALLIFVFGRRAAR